MNSTFLSAFLSLILTSSLSLSADADKYKSSVELEWEEMLGASKYQILIDSTFTKKSLSIDSTLPTFKFKIAPGTYSVKGRVADERGVFGEWSKPETLIVTPPTPKLDKILATQDLEKSFKPDPKKFITSVPLSWKPVIGAFKYRLTITDSKNNIKIIETAKPEELIKLRPGTYKIQLQTIAEDGTASELSTISSNLNIQTIPIPEVANILESKTQDQYDFDLENDLKIKVELERQSFFASKWTPVLQEYVFQKWWRKPSGLKPGRYQVRFYHENEYKEYSPPVIKEFLVKPTEDELK